MTMEYKNILVPVDGSKTAENALKTATEIAKRNQGHVDLLNVIDLKQFSMSFGGMVDANGDVVYQSFEDVNEYLEKLQAEVKANGLDAVDIHARFGTPRTIVAKEFPLDHHTDLIVMGPTGMNVVERALMGAVTDYVTRNAVCDVMVAR
ncbi:universal stress protein [Ligilactobacillus equi]|nr:universal stress protein [Ligilactobacillus equi]